MENLIKHKYAKPLILVAYVLAISILTGGYRDLFFGDEVRYADVYTHLKEGNFIALTLNGEPYPDKPPLFFIFIYIIQLLTGITAPKVLFVATSITGVMFILSSYYFLKITTEDENLSFYSNLLLVSNLYTIALINFVKMDLMFSFFILLSFSFFYKYFSEKNILYNYLAFIMAGIAVMVKGLLGIVFPLLSFVVFCILKKEYKCILNIHFLIGFIISLFPTIAWILALINIYGYDYVYNSIFYQQTVRRAVDAFHSKKPFYFYIYVLPIVWIPISLILILKIKKLKESLINFYRYNNNGYPYISIIFITSFVILSLVSSKFANYLLPIFPMFAAFLYFILKKFDAKKIFWLTISAFYIILSIFSLGLLIYNNKINFLDRINYAWMVAVVGIFISLSLIISLKKSNEHLILTYAFCIIIFSNTLNLTFVIPASSYFSPKPIGDALKIYAEQGYKPISFDTYSGTYSFYTGRPVLETRDRKLLEDLLSREKIVVAMSEKNWNRWENRPTTLKIVKRQFMMNKYYLVLTN